MPGLASYQSALAAAVGGGVFRQVELGGISEAGIAMTARVRRSWCIARAGRAAPLTLSSLPQALRDRVLAEWVELGGGTHSFFEKEAELFLTFIAGHLAEPSHQLSLCRFELAAIKARAAAESFEPSICVPAPADRLRRSADAALIALNAPIGDLLGALEGSCDWPAVADEPQYLLVAPGIDGVARPASGSEIALWRAAEAGVPAGRKPRAAADLVACGALRIELATEAP